jgi:short-subunit dehydrogenase
VAIFSLTADTSKKEDIIKVFKMVNRDLGEIDILIDNAGLAADTVSEMSIEDQQYIVKTNLLGYLAVVHEAIKRMKPKGKGHIVVVGSMSANIRAAGSSVYVATKSGVQGFTEALRKEVREFGIKVSLIEPGEVGTDMNELSPVQQRQKQLLLKQLKAEDIADCICYVLTRAKRVDITEMKVLTHLEDI